MGLGEKINFTLQNSRITGDRNCIAVSGAKAKEDVLHWAKSYEKNGNVIILSQDLKTVMDPMVAIRDIIEHNLYSEKFLSKVSYKNVYSCFEKIFDIRGFSQSEKRNILEKISFKSKGGSYTEVVVDGLDKALDKVKDINDIFSYVGLSSDKIEMIGKTAKKLTSYWLSQCKRIIKCTDRLNELKDEELFQALYEDFAFDINQNGKECVIILYSAERIESKYYSWVIDFLRTMAKATISVDLNFVLVFESYKEYDLQELEKTDLKVRSFDQGDSNSLSESMWEVVADKLLDEVKNSPIEIKTVALLTFLCWWPNKKTSENPLFKTFEACEESLLKKGLVGIAKINKIEIKDLYNEERKTKIESQKSFICDNEEFHIYEMNQDLRKWLIKKLFQYHSDIANEIMGYLICDMHSRLSGDRMHLKQFHSYLLILSEVVEVASDKYLGDIWRRAYENKKYYRELKKNLYCNIAEYSISIVNSVSNMQTLGPESETRKKDDMAEDKDWNNKREEALLDLESNRDKQKENYKQNLTNCLQSVSSENVCAETKDIKECLPETIVTEPINECKIESAIEFTKKMETESVKEKMVTMDRQKIYEKPQNGVTIEHNDINLDFRGRLRQRREAIKATQASTSDPDNDNKEVVYDESWEMKFGKEYQSAKHTLNKLIEYKDKWSYEYMKDLFEEYRREWIGYSEEVMGRLKKEQSEDYDYVSMMF